MVLTSDLLYSILFYKHHTKGIIIKHKIVKYKVPQMTSNLKWKVIWGIYIKVC